MMITRVIVSSSLFSVGLAIEFDGVFGIEPVTAAAATDVVAVLALGLDVVGKGGLVGNGTKSNENDTENIIFKLT